MAAAPPIAPPAAAPAPAPAANGAFELQPIAESSLADLDMSLVREYMRTSDHRRPGSSVADLDPHEALRVLRAVDGPPGRERLTVLGALFFGVEPGRLLVQSKVRFVEFPGTDTAGIGDGVSFRYSEEFEGTVPELIARMERLHKERLAPGVLADGFRVEELPVLPLLALREAMVNAVCHRDYALAGANIQVRLFADRLEVQSPGGLPDPVTVENLLDESYARNPRLADMLRDLGYVERHGLGIDNIVRSMKAAHLPPPEFSDSASSFTVTLRFRAAGEPDSGDWLTGIGAEGLPEADRRALLLARRVGAISGSDYRALNLAGGPDSEERLRELVRDGWLVQLGTGEGATFALGPRAGSKAAAPTADTPVPVALLDSLPKTQRRVLEILSRHGRLRAGEVLELSGLRDRRTIQRALAALTERGLLLRRASSPTDPNASYEVVPEGAGVLDDD